MTNEICSIYEQTCKSHRVMSVTQCKQLLSFSQAAVDRLQTHLDASYSATCLNSEAECRRRGMSSWSPCRDLSDTWNSTKINFEFMENLRMGERIILSAPASDHEQAQLRVATRMNCILDSILQLVFTTLKKRDLKPPALENTGTKIVLLSQRDCLCSFLCVHS